MIERVSRLVGRLPGDRRGRPQPGLRHRGRRDGGRRADHARRLGPAASAYRPSREEILALDEPDLQAARRRRDRRLRRDRARSATRSCATSINGGFQGEIYPINPKADEILGLHAYRASPTCPARSTSRSSPSPPSSCAAALEEVGRKGRRRRDPDPVRLRRDRRASSCQDEIVEIAAQARRPDARAPTSTATTTRRRTSAPRSARRTTSRAAWR